MGYGIKLENTNDEIRSLMTGTLIFVDKTNWVSSNGKITNTINVKGLTSSSEIIMTIRYNKDVRTDVQDEAYALITGGTTDTNKIILEASAIPTVSLYVVLKGNIGVANEEIGNFEDVTNKLENIKSDLDMQTSRINNIIRLEDGSTTGDAELQDARIGYDNTTYDNLGNAIRTQVSDLHDSVDNIATIIPISLSSTIDKYILTSDTTQNIYLNSLQFVSGKTYTFYLSADVEIDNLSTQFAPTFRTKGQSQDESLYYNRVSFALYKRDDTYPNMRLTGTFSLSNRTDILDFALSFTNCMNTNGRVVVKNIKFVVIDNENIKNNENIDNYYNYFDFVAGTNKDIVILEKQPTSSSVKINCWGDSLTQGIGAVNSPYPTELQTLIGSKFKVINNGVGGESTYPIMARMGVSALWTNNITISANSISPIAIDVFSTIADQGANLRDKTGEKGLSDVLIDGVKGSITVSDDYTKIYFTPKEPLSVAKNITRPSLILSEKDNSNDINIVFMGQNGGWNTVSWFIKEYEQIAKWSKNGKYIFIGLTTGSYNERHTMELEFSFSFGEHYINARDYLVKYGLLDNGLTPTESDTTAIEKGQIPPQLMSDSVHGNDYFYKSLAKAIYLRGKGLGYWN